MSDVETAVSPEEAGAVRGPNYPSPQKPVSNQPPKLFTQEEIDNIADELITCLDIERPFMTVADAFNKEVVPILEGHLIPVPSIPFPETENPNDEEFEYFSEVGKLFVDADNMTPVYFVINAYREKDQLYRVHADLMNAEDFERYQWALDDAVFDAGFAEPPAKKPTPQSPPIYKDIKIDRAEPDEPSLLPDHDDDYMIIHPIISDKEL